MKANSVTRQLSSVVSVKNLCSPGNMQLVLKREMEMFSPQAGPTFIATCLCGEQGLCWLRASAGGVWGAHIHSTHGPFSAQPGYSPWGLLEIPPHILTAAGSRNCKQSEDCQLLGGIIACNWAGDKKKFPSCSQISCGRSVETMLSSKAQALAA